MAVSDPIEPPDAPVDILVVDDDARNLEALENMLAPLAQRIVRCSSGADALRCILERDFALALIDVQMPGLDGLQTTRLVRSRERSRSLPIIFLAALTRNVDEMAQAYQLGAVDFLFKPIVPMILRSKVQAFVALHRKTEELARQGRILHDVARRERERLAEAAQRWETERGRLLDEITGRRRVSVPEAAAVTDERLSAADRITAPPARETMPSLRVMVVEDDDDIRESMRGMLELGGQRTTVAADGPSAVEAVLSERPDVAFIDIGLPGLDGYQVVSALRSRAPDLPTRLVAVTAYGRAEDRNRALSAGFHEHAVKPVTSDELMRLLLVPGGH